MSVTLKLATSLDGRIATASGESRWITGPESRAQGHRLRAAHDAVLVGAETAIADDPELTVRLDDYAGRQPTRVVLDSRQRMPPGGKLARTATNVPVILVTTAPADPALTGLGVRVLTVAGDAQGRVDPAAAVAGLAAEGVRSILIEGGGQVAAAFLRAGLVDAIEWFRAPILLGAEGRPAIGDLAVAALAQAPHYQRAEVSQLGDDLWERYVRA
jgi:diaminohydroxyphosphoribosylaminopyrimidine deaminase / 5-amino-6-(5-phosphoribosylamino)uracil reductase